MRLNFATASETPLLGQPAPSFTLPDQAGEVKRLSDYQGKWVVLYFYPKDDTPGCTTEACNFRDDIMQIRALGAEVLGVSTDSTRRHEKFATKHKLPYPLLADTEGKVAASYGAIGHFALIKLAKRHSFIIDPQGVLVKIYRDVKPARHSDEIIADLKALLAEAS